MTVSVTADMSEHDIGKMLKEEGLVEDANLFYAQVKLSATPENSNRCLHVKYLDDCAGDVRDHGSGCR